jgi:arylsulfatase A-like enzyme
MSQVIAARRPWETITRGLGALFRAGTEASAKDAAAVRRGQAEMLALVLAVGTAIFLTKTFIAYRDLANPAAPPLVCDGGDLRTLARVAACCAEDFAVGLGCFLLAAAALRRLRSPWGRLAVRGLAYLSAVVVLCLMVVNAQLYHAVRHYLTFTLVQLAGGLHWERSISDHATVPFRLALALVPVLTLAVQLGVLSAFPRYWRAVAARAGRPVVVVAGIVVCGGVAAAAQNGLVVSGTCDYPHNPLLHFLRSLVHAPTIARYDGDDEDLANLAPGRPGHTPGLLASRPKNIIVIAAESVGMRYLQAYGSPLETTPNLCRFEAAGRSVTFDNFYASGNHTIAAGLPILGGMYNDPTTLATLIEYPDFPLPRAPAWLQGQGYTTCFFASGGRSVWEDYRNSAAAFAGRGFDVGRDPTHPFWQSQARPAAFLDEDHLDVLTFADLRRAVREFRDRKFAMWLWTFDTHSIYYDGPGPRTFPREHFPPSVLDRGDKERDFQGYLRAIWRLDWLVAELYRDLEELGLADETLIVVVGDHGEEFGEHGWFGHNWSVYDTEVRVPCVLIGPRLAPLVRRSAAVGGHVDLWATITDVCGLPADPRWQGRSLFNGDADGRRAYFYRGNADLGVREGRYKYVWDYEQDRQHLYNIEADPAEQHNLAAAEPERCAAFQKRVRAWAAFQTRLTKERLAEASGR